MGDFNTPLSVMNLTAGVKINRKRNLSSTRHQPDPQTPQDAHHRRTLGCTLRLSRTDHEPQILKNESTQDVRDEIRTQGIGGNGKFTSMWRLSNKLLNKQWEKEEITREVRK